MKVIGQQICLKPLAQNLQIKHKYLPFFFSIMQYQQFESLLKVVG